MDFKRGDRVTVKSQQIIIKPTLFKQVVNLVREVYTSLDQQFIKPLIAFGKKVIEYWKIIVAIGVFIALLPTIVFLFKLVSKLLTQWIENRRLKKKKEEEEGGAAGVEITKLPEVPENYPSGVLEMVKLNKKASSDVLNYWLGLYDEK